MLISVMTVLSSVVVMDSLSESSIVLAPFVVRCVGFVVGAGALGGDSVAL